MGIFSTLTTLFGAKSDAAYPSIDRKFAAGMRARNAEPLSFEGMAQ